MLSIVCRCGQKIEVRESQAGSVVQCACGLELIVPDLRVLRQHSDRGKPATAVPVEEYVQVVDPSHHPDPDERRFLVFLTHPQVLPQRISFDAASHFVTACDRLLQQYFADREHQWDIDLQVAMALLPDGQTLIEIQSQPAILPDHAADELTNELSELSSPMVVDGPVAFAIRRPVCGGAPTAIEFDIPFRSFIRGRGDLDQILLAAAGLAPAGESDQPGPSWLGWIWSRIVRFVRGPGRDEEVAGDAAGEEPAQTIEDAEIAAAIESGSLDEVRACLAEYPEVPSLHYCLGSLLVREGQFQEAAAAYTKLIQLDPDNAAAHAARGRAHCLAGSMQHGLSDYSRAIELDPADPESRAARAVLYLELEAWQVAESDLTCAIALAPIQPHLYLERARARYAQQNTSEAQHDLRRALQLDPYYVEAYMLSGWILQHLPDATLDDIVAAADFYSQAIAIEPDNPAYLVQRAEAYAGQSKFALTISDCDRALELDPDHAIAYGIRGYAHQQLDNLSEAVADCTKAIELGLQSAAVYFSRAVGYAAAGDVDRALTDCDTAIELAPDYAAAFNYRGMLKLGQGDVESATEDFAEASRLAPDWSTPHEFRADAHRLQLEYERAIEQYNDTIELDPKNFSAHIGRALAWIEQQDYDKAWADLTTALEIDDESVQAYFHRGELSMRREQYDQALPDLDRAIELDADFAPAYHARAHTYMQLQRNEDAIRDFNKLIDLHPTWAGAYVGRAHAWINLGDPHKASADYSEAAQLDPGSAEELRVHRLIVEAHHLHEREEYDAAIEKATEALDQDQDSLPALATRAASYWYSEQFVEAVDDYSHLIELHADASFAYVGRGQVYAELGEYELALRDLDTGVDMERKAASETGLAYALNGRALAYAGLQRFGEAESDFEESIRLRPDNAWVHYNCGLVHRMRDELAAAAASFQRALELENPQLTKRKRERAWAFLQQYGM